MPRSIGPSPSGPASRGRAAGRRWRPIRRGVPQRAPVPVLGAAYARRPHRFSRDCPNFRGSDIHAAMRELAPGTVVAGYRIESLIGRGGMGVVYRAVQRGLERVVALKVIAPELLDDEDVRARFLAEARAAASVDHPNVIPVHDAGEDDGIAYIAMRYVAGDDLRSLVRRGGALDPAEAAEHRRPGRRRAGRDPPRRLRAPRRQAREPARRRRAPRLPDRLRARQGRCSRAPGGRAPASGWGRSTTSRRSRSAAGGSTRAPTCTRSAACCTSR